MDTTTFDRAGRIANLKHELAILEAEEKRELAEAAAARMAEYERTRADNLEDMKAESMVAQAPSWKGVADYILPVGREFGKVKPTDPETFPFGGSDWTKHSHVLVCKRTDQNRKHASRAVFGSGTPSEDWKIGQEWTFRHDQTNGYLGEYIVVGIVVFDANGQVVRAEGEDLDRKLNLAVFK